jgi:protein-S-isoprenylcysteine O-methyltransferase Ste14
MQHPTEPTPEAVGMRMPPPVAVALFGAGASVLEYLWPTSFAAGPVPTVLGAALVASGLTLIGLAAVALRRVGTSPDPRRSVHALAEGGIYRVSRNPIYLGMATVLLGAGLWSDSAWVAASALPAWAVLQRTIVAREEAYLAARFPAQYSAYTARVRRWF